MRISEIDQAIQEGCTEANDLRLRFGLGEGCGQCLVLLRDHLANPDRKTGWSNSLLCSDSPLKERIPTARSQTA
ncbi:MAG: (2Fe-2S)-binding protein [Gammaproteobacteria bacterium AqS3]|nr:(2Fe-2S)-binding protein [Gammaproteobacteria bacterium AqS3]